MINEDLKKGLKNSNDVITAILLASVSIGILQAVNDALKEIAKENVILNKGKNQND